MPDHDHKTLIAALPAEVRQTLVAQTDHHGLKHFALHGGAIVLGALLIAARVPLWQLVVPLQGILICFLFTTLHETSHNTPFKTDRLNTIVGRICGFAILLAPVWFRYFHLAHHRHTHDPDHDPELASPKPETPLQYLVYLSGIPETFARIATLLRNATQPNTDSYVPARAKAKIRTEARVQLGLYAALIAASIAAQSALLLWVWVVPYIVGAPVLRGYLLAEHARCPNVTSMLDNTRTTLTNRAVRFIAWNMPYHAEHHAYPSVPFHQLPAFHAHTKAHISHLDTGYLPFNADYLRDARSGALATEART